ncbi:hypothetical protein DV704_02450 [Meiothermus sp. QL-1]|uniref:hypothetical protein n=1 Tax=Meiothermus sp. QL-1 TaxID=2058095 RepID=UPI000E0A68FA|nr:hypothetical protein [Meiothermus sp. QL-1]RDI96687.1 hypothetical protein DV704_02450 [Meiothermus sp. QL-1]
MPHNLEIDPQPLLLQSLETGELPDLEGMSLAREYAREKAQGHAGENEIVRWSHGPGGFYYEFKKLPAAFYARLGPIQGQYLSAKEAQELVWEALVRAEKEPVELVLFYTPQMQDPQDFYLAYNLGHTRIERGEPRYALPLFLRLKDHQQLWVMLRDKNAFLLFRLEQGQPLLGGLGA